MSNGSTHSLKRDVDAAFGEGSQNSSKKFRRQSKKSSSKQQRRALEAKTIPSENTNSTSRNEPSEAPAQSKPRPQESHSDAAAKPSQRRDSKRLEGREKGGARKKQSKGSGLSLSRPEGGRFGEHDPILVQRDSYMILALRTQILVYSTATSHPVRSLQVAGQETITSYSISAANKNHLFVSTYSGLVLEWDWTIGKEIGRWAAPQKLLFLSAQLQDHTDTTSPALLLIYQVSDQIRRLSRCTLTDSSRAIITETALLEQRSLASWTKVLDEGRCLVLYADDKLLLGHAASRPGEVLTSYVWREVTIGGSITSIDARSHNMSSGTKKKRFAVDVVVGCHDGSINIYDDILFNLTSRERDPKQDAIISRRFHWHRNEVLAVKWSLDGNYVISGGHETVMVIWQLDTGQQQFLPHLSAAIRHLTVSQTGSSYALHLADNSVMVLSTSELQPTAYTSGLVLRPNRSNGKNAGRVPAVLHHADPTILALAVPADDSIGCCTPVKATLLQNYDIRAQQQLHRQALVRNNITALQVAPSGNPVQEPDVTHLKISHDGKWLATVDEWTPPEHDLKPLYCTIDDPSLDVRETFLKFWTKNESTESWELVTKITRPYSTRVTAPVSILDLQANPQRSEFSTISTDGSVYIWIPKRRHRNGLPVTDQSGAQLYTWTCTHTIEFPMPLKRPFPTTNALAYSFDGSVLAASSNKSPFIHFINPRTGRVQHTQHGSHPGQVCLIAFLNHHLISISRDLRVYNTVNGELLYALALSSSVSDVHLAVNPLDQTFSVVCLLPAFLSKEDGPEAKARSQIMVFDLKSAYPVFKKIVERTVEILLPLSGEDGYLIINDEAEVVYLRRPGGGSAATRYLKTPFVEESLKTNRLEDIFRRRGIEPRSGDATKAITDGNVQPDRNETGQQLGLGHREQSSLSDVFRYSDNLRVRELFEQVATVLGNVARIQAGA